MAGPSLPAYSRSQPLTLLWVLMVPVLATLAVLVWLNRGSAAGPVLRVVLRRGGSLRIGSDEPARLASFIQARLPAAQRPA
jgi:hypothetical protein